MGDKEKNPVTVPYIAHESEMARRERTEKRLWVLVILLAVMLFGSNLAWTIYESQFEMVEETTVTQEVTQDTDGGNNHFIGGDYYGETDG